MRPRSRTIEANSVEEFIQRATVAQKLSENPARPPEKNSLYVSQFKSKSCPVKTTIVKTLNSIWEQDEIEYEASTQPDLSSEQDFIESNFESKCSFEDFSDKGEIYKLLGFSEPLKMLRGSS
jgi:hypothetical protein